MKILITDSKGFVSENLIRELYSRNYSDILEYDPDTGGELLDDYCKQAEFVFHLAGVNPPKEQGEFTEGNTGFISSLLDTLKKNKNACPVMISSSTQAAIDNPDGQRIKAGEDLLFSYAGETGAKVLVYRFPNVFGKWCSPDHNSAVATFCNNIASNLPIQVDDRNVTLNLVYIDDVVNELINALTGKENRNNDGFCYVPAVYTVTLGQIADLIYSFKSVRKELMIPDVSDEFTKKLYSTYLSYLPTDAFSYSLKMNRDNRGSFTEIIRTPDRGQVSVNSICPGITKGNHWHHTKNEKFVVVAGKGVIRFRKVGSSEVHEYFVSGDKIEAVDIPIGYIHNIENLGDTDLIFFIWTSELFNPEKLDTYFEKV